MTKRDPFQPVDDDARTLARQLLFDAPHAALATLLPDSGAPSVTRIALATDPGGMPLSLISTLAVHTQNLMANPACSLLIGDPGDKGDPLTHPRLTLHCTAQPVPRDSNDHASLRGHYLSLRPKAKLYVDFADFSFVRFAPSDGLLNGGFGKAYKLTPADLTS